MISADDQRARVGWLARRGGIGATSAELDELVHADDPIDALIGSPAHGDATHGDGTPGDATDGPGNDPWDGATPGGGVDGRQFVVSGWIRQLLSTTTPFVERRTSLLHGWLVSSLADAPPAAMATQIRLFRAVGGGSFPDLLRAVSVDPAMLVYLDGRTSVAGAPNENYGRELLELFSLGTGGRDGPAPYTEDDVTAVATALTGWVVQRNDPTARFVPRRHDDTPQTVLGVDGVHDLDGVIDAIVAHPEHDRFVAERVATQFVGVDDPSLPDGGRPDPAVVELLADAYRAADRHLDPVIDAALRVVFDGEPTGSARPIVAEPALWLAATSRMLGLDAPSLARTDREQVRSMGQVPMYPPTVAGWPGGLRWLTTSALVARSNVAAALAAAATRSAGRDDASPAVVAAIDGDLDALAAHLGVVEPFTPTTAAAIRGAADPTGRLTLALVSPEYLVT